MQFIHTAVYAYGQGLAPLTEYCTSITVAHSIIYTPYDSVIGSGACTLKAHSVLSFVWTVLHPPFSSGAIMIAKQWINICTIVASVTLMLFGKW